MGNSTMKTVGEYHWNVTIKDHRRKKIFQGHLSLNLRDSLVFILCIYIQSVYYISSSHHNSAYFKVRRLGKGMFPAGQGSDDWKTQASLHCSCLSHAQSAVKYRI